MFPGFFIGTVFLFLLVRAVFWGPRYRFHRYHAGYHHPWWSDDDGPPPWPWDDSRRRRHRRQRDVESDRAVSEAADVVFSPRGRVDEAVREFVRSLRSRLRATPAQERALEAAVARLRDAAEHLRAGMNEARDDLARAMRADAFDEPAFEAASLRLDETVLRMRAVER
jgi:hypothetical protein